MIGTTVAHFRIVERLGEGGMGEVYLAEDARLGRTVALKFLAPRLEGRRRARERFLREARTEAAVDHPNICPVYDVGETEDGRTFIAMAYCDGVTLRERIPETGLPVEEAVGFAVQIAAGLAAAHARGIVHRDLKPRNIMVSPDGDVRIVDFGLAFLAHRTRVTRSGDAVGTFRYMSPEQAHGETVRAASDVFSFGIVLYEMLTGLSPFQASSDAAVIRRIVEHRPEPVTALRPDVPPELAAIVEKALAKDVGDRYRDAGEMLAALRAFRGDRPSGSFPRVTARRPRPVLRTAASALAAVVVLVAVSQLPGGADGCFRPPESAGIAVLPEVREGEPERVRWQREGFADYLALAIGPPAEDSGAWVVAPSARREAHVTRPGDAGTVLGAGRAILVGGSPDSVWTLSLVDIASGRVKASVETPEPSFSPALRLLGLPDNASDAGAPAPASFLTGLARLLDGQAAAAVPDLEDAVRMDGAFAPALASLGEALFVVADGDGDPGTAARAEAACRGALAQDARLATPRITLARLHLRGNDTDAAIAVLQEAVKERPGNVEAHRWLGRAFLRADRTADAGDAFRAATVYVPDAPGGWEGYGAFLYFQGDYEGARQVFERVRALAPGYGETYNYLGACYYALDCWTESTLMFERSFEIARNPMACANLGTLYYMDDRFEDAVRMYDFALEYDPDDFAVQTSRAAALYWTEGRRPESLDAFRRSAEMGEALLARGGNVQVQALLAGVWAHLRDPRAEDGIRQALQRAPEDPEVLFRAALAYESLGQRETALVTLGHLLDHETMIAALQHEAFLDSLRADPRYTLLTKDLPKVECRTPPSKGVGT